MESNYRPIKLEDILTPVRETIEIDPLQIYKQVTIRLNHKGVVLREEISGQLIKSKQYKANTGQFTISRIDARNGAMGLIPPELDGAIVTNDFLLYNINEQRLYPKYFDYLTSTSQFVNECIKASKGTTNRVRLNPEMFLEIEISFPSLNEQKRIVAIIDRMMKRVNEARRQRVEAAENIKCLASSLYFQIFDEIREKFSSKKLSCVTKILGGGTPYKGQPDYWDGDISWVSPKDMKSEYIYDSQDHITQFAISNSSVLLIPSNSVLVVVRSGILARKIPVAINRIPVTINQDMKSLIPNESLMPEYLKWWIKGNEGIILKNVEQGTTVHRIIWNNMKEMYVPLPPIAIQYDIVAHLDALQEKIEELEKLQEKMERDMVELVPSVLQKAFAGEL